MNKEFSVKEISDWLGSKYYSNMKKGISIDIDDLLNKLSKSTHVLADDITPLTDFGVSQAIDSMDTHNFNAKTKVVNYPEMGDYVKRGPDWKWGKQDCNEQGMQTVGKIVIVTTDSHQAGVIWNNKDTDDIMYYNTGLDDEYDLYYADYNLTLNEYSIALKLLLKT